MLDPVEPFGPGRVPALPDRSEIGVERDQEIGLKPPPQVLDGTVLLPTDPGIEAEVLEQVAQGGLARCTGTDHDDSPGISHWFIGPPYPKLSCFRHRHHLYGSEDMSLAPTPGWKADCSSLPGWPR